MIKQVRQIKPDTQFFEHLVKYGYVGILNDVFTFIIYFALLKIFKNGIHRLGPTAGAVPYYSPGGSDQFFGIKYWRMKPYENKS